MLSQLLVVLRSPALEPAFRPGGSLCTGGRPLSSCPFSCLCPGNSIEVSSSCAPGEVSKCSVGEEDRGSLRHTETTCPSWREAWERNHSREGWRRRPAERRGCHCQQWFPALEGLCPWGPEGPLPSFTCVHFPWTDVAVAFVVMEVQIPRNNPAQCNPRRDWQTVWG